MAIPYEEFKEKFNKLCEHTLEKPDDEIDLSVYHQIPSAHINECNQKHSACGAPLCLAGNLPEVFPGEFEWSAWGAVVSAPFHRSGVVYALAGADRSDPVTYLSRLMNLFNKNQRELTDRQEIERRQKLVNSSNSYEELEWIL